MVTWTELIYEIIPPAISFVKYYYNIDLWVNTSAFAEKDNGVSPFWVLSPYCPRSWGAG